jgi:hypothetical protein
MKEKVENKPKEGGKEKKQGQQTAKMVDMNLMQVCPPFLLSTDLES